MEVQGNKEVAKCRVCGVELTDENWYLCNKKKHVYICRSCAKQQGKQYYKTHKKKKRQYGKQYRETHKEEIKQRNKRYLKTHGEEIRKRDKLRSRIKKYGITIKQELEMLEKQENKCAICGKKLSNLTEANIDHDHSTGKVRGLLCNNCNTAIGMLRETPELFDKAKEYILKHKEIDNGNQE